MTKKIILLSGEGIGNTIQLLPLMITLQTAGYTVDFCHLFGSFNIDVNIFPYINKVLTPSDLQVLDPTEYIGKVSTMWTKDYINSGNLRKLDLLANIHYLSMEESEVNTYMKIATDLGIKDEDLIWEARCNYTESEEEFDVVIADGYNKNGNWDIKGYPYYAKVASKLLSRGLRIACIGSKDEYVDGTIDMTGLPLMQSLGVIKNTTVLISNDTFAYHASNALAINNIPIFTATSLEKNYDERFHKWSHIVGRDDLSCRPCQSNRGWKTCKNWECQNINPDIIVQKTLEILEVK